MIPTNWLRCMLPQHDWHLKRGGSSSCSAVCSNVSVHLKNSIKRWCVGLRGCVKLLPQSVTIQTRGSFANWSLRANGGMGLNWQSLITGALFTFWARRGRFFCPLPLPPFPPFHPNPEPATKNYAHCLIPDMDGSRQRVWRLRDK